MAAAAASTAWSGFAVTPRDFDRWAELGCDGWDYGSGLPYFKQAETFRRGDPAYRETDGPQRVTRVEIPHVVMDAFVSAAVKTGRAFVDDYNGGTQEGVSFGQANTRHGFREGTARVYLIPVRRRPKLTVLTSTQVERILVEDGTAVGVEVRRRDGKAGRIPATREVSVRAGALGSPKLLMLSGIGPGEALGRSGISVVKDRPGVGANLQEHPVAQLVYNVDTHTSNMEFTARDVGRHGARFLFEGQGPAASSFFNAHRGGGLGLAAPGLRTARSGAGQERRRSALQMQRALPGAGRDPERGEQRRRVLFAGTGIVHDTPPVTASIRTSAELSTPRPAMLQGKYFRCQQSHGRL